jgi:hypothetical protein
MRWISYSGFKSIDFHAYKGVYFPECFLPLRSACCEVLRNGSPGPGLWRGKSDSADAASRRQGGAGHAADCLLSYQTAIADSGGSRYLIML